MGWPQRALRGLRGQKNTGRRVPGPGEKRLSRIAHTWNKRLLCLLSRQGDEGLLPVENGELPNLKSIPGNRFRSRSFSASACWTSNNYLAKSSATFSPIGLLRFKRKSLCDGDCGAWGFRLSALCNRWCCFADDSPQCIGIFYPDFVKDHCYECLRMRLNL